MACSAKGDLSELNWTSPDWMKENLADEDPAMYPMEDNFVGYSGGNPGQPQTMRGVEKGNGLEVRYKGPTLIDPAYFEQ